MAERLDALTVRESNGKSYFTKIGAAFPNRVTQVSNLLSQPLRSSTLQPNATAAFGKSRTRMVSPATDRMTVVAPQFAPDM